MLNGDSGHALALADALRSFARTLREGGTTDT